MFNEILQNKSEFTLEDRPESALKLFVFNQSFFQPEIIPLSVPEKNRYLILNQVIDVLSR